VEGSRLDSRVHAAKRLLQRGGGRWGRKAPAQEKSGVVLAHRRETGGGGLTEWLKSAQLFSPWGVRVMSGAMRGRGVGGQGVGALAGLGPAASRLAASLLAASLLAGLAACANSSASTEPNERMAAQTAPLHPQQVVQRIEPALPEGATAERALAAKAQQAAPEVNAEASEAAPAAVATGGAGAGSEEPRVEEPRAEGARPAAITPKHLEAELNRLEDELRK
ncbi:MAG: hypothetical protein RL033_6143, partial [Pseudomonadota bacterium]